MSSASPLVIPAERSESRDRAPKEAPSPEDGPGSAAQRCRAYAVIFGGSNLEPFHSRGRR
jgi:hypothetical protein